MYIRTKFMDPLIFPTFSQRLILFDIFEHLDMKEDWFCELFKENSWVMDQICIPCPVLNFSFHFIFVLHFLNKYLTHKKSQSDQINLVSAADWTAVFSHTHRSGWNSFDHFLHVKRYYNRSLFVCVIKLLISQTAELFAWIIWFCWSFSFLLKRGKDEPLMV